MSEAGYDKVIGGDTVIAELDTYTQGDYARRMQPAREGGMEALGAIFSAFGIAAGVLCLLNAIAPEGTISFAPMKYGVAGIGAAMIGLAMGGSRDQMGRWALSIATGGWLIGSVLAIIFDKTAY